MRLLVPLLLLPLISCGSRESADSGDARRYDDAGVLLQGSAPRERPNVLFVSIDTLRADHLGCYGYRRATSPHIDALARDSIRFAEAISAAPWTTPAHLSLMTSLAPEAHGVLAYPAPGRLHGGIVTLAEILASQGWCTGGFTEGGYAKGSTGLADGFETFPSWPRDEQGFISHELEPSRIEENLARALGWMRAHAAEPFFLFFHTYEPHFEYRPLSEDILALDPDFHADAERGRLAAAIEAWNTERGLSPADKGLLYRHYLQGDLLDHPVKRTGKLWPMLTRFVEREWRRSPTFAEDLAYVTLLYDAEIRRTDRAVGALLRELDALDVADETLVVLTADHGEGLMDHEELQHGFHLYRELLHIPLLLRLPAGSRPEPRTVDPLVRGVDVMPTILDALGLPAPRAAQGSSLLALVRAAEVSEPRIAFAEGLTIRDGERNLLMVRRGPFKLVRDTAQGRDYLYDLAADPEERRNVLRTADPTLLAELRTALERWTAANAREAARYPAAPGTLDQAERDRLQQLGYADVAPDH